MVREVAQRLSRKMSPAPPAVHRADGEPVLADNAEAGAHLVLKALKGLGETLALDDFGTHYSSLGCLTQLPFDKLKIDRVLVDGITDSDRAGELLKGIVALGRGLGMIVVAEGVEQRGEVEIIREFGCNLAQGYVYARPGVAADAISFARSREPCGDRPATVPVTEVQLTKPDVRDAAA